jgi:myo-inositol 2-dehydrogenase / D-chiro-inositol 1-dehydrogenase
VRVGIIGAGWIAAEHVTTLRKLEGVSVVGVCDIDQTRARELANGAPAYTDWREMIAREKPEAVFVCTPPLTHRELAVAALEQGLHVYLEKPIARGLEDARAIVDAAARSRAVCAVGYQWRGVEVLDDLRQAMTGQEIGLLIAISTGPTKSRPWFLDRAQGGGNLLERASHSIDLERAIAGEVVSVQAAPSRVLLAQSPNRRGNIDDAAALVLHFANGGLGVVQVAWTKDGLPGTYSLDVHASGASFHLELDPTFALHGKTDGRAVEATSGQHPHERSLVRFIEAAREHKREHVFCSPQDAAGTLAVAVACEEALTTGTTIPVPSY